MRTWILAILICLCLPVSATAAPITAYGGHTGHKVIAVNPIIGVGLDGWFTPTTYLFFGVSERWDIVVGGGPTLAPPDDGGFQGGYVEGLVRAFLDRERLLALVLHLGYDSSLGPLVGGELHLAASTERFAFTANGGAVMYPGHRGYAASYVHAIVVPELLLGPLSIFVEIRPALFMPGFGMSMVPELTLTPGVGTAFGPDDEVTVSLGMALPLAPEDTAPAIMLGVYAGIPTTRKAG